MTSDDQGAQRGPAVAGLDQLEGRTALVTGGTGGIGLFTAWGLAELGATVFVSGRDEARGRAAVSHVREATGGEVHLLLADLSSVDGVRALAADVSARSSTLDLLVNNAGALPMARTSTCDGFELTWAVNHLAPFLLTSLLLDDLRGSPAGRVVNVTSSAARLARLSTGDVEREPKWGVMAAYGRSKAAGLAMTAEWAQRLRTHELSFVAADPGGADTTMTQAMTRDVMPTPMRLLFPVFARFGPRSRSAQAAARSSLVAAASPEVAGRSGVLVTARGQIGELPRRSTDPELRARLWSSAVRQLALDQRALPAEIGHERAGGGASGQGPVPA